MMKKFFISLVLSLTLLGILSPTLPLLATENSMTYGPMYDGTSWMFRTKTGEIATGWVYYEGEWYYFTETGVAQPGWLFDEDSWYFITETGEVHTGWLTYEGSRYYFLEDNGAMITGGAWILDDIYHFSDTGVMQTGWVLIEDIWYLYSEYGTLIESYADNELPPGFAPTPEMRNVELHIRSNLLTVGNISESEIDRFVAELLKAPDVAHSNIENYVLSEYDSMITLDYLLGNSDYPTNPRPTADEATSLCIGALYHDTEIRNNAIYKVTSTYLIATVNYLEESTLHEVGHSLLFLTAGYIDHLSVSDYEKPRVSFAYNFSFYNQFGPEWYAEAYAHFLMDPEEFATVSQEAYDYFVNVASFFPAAIERNDRANNGY